MAETLTMPKLSDSMEEAVILRWLKAPGDKFARGEPLVEIETDKATMVYEAEADGVIARLVVEEGGAARVGEPIAMLGDGTASPTPGRDLALAAVPSPGPNPPKRVATPEPHTKSEPGADRARATPVARRRAVELGVSLFGLSGTGPGGRITRRDVEAAAAVEPRPGVDSAAGERPGRGDVETVQLTPTQSTIAKRMLVAATTIPTFDASIEIDMSTVVALRRDPGAMAAAPSLNDFVVRAVALTLSEFPAFNSSFVDGHIERYSRINVGIAVAIEDALLVPVVFDADRKSLFEVAAETRSLAARAKARSLSSEELTQGTFTVSNLGMYGVHSFRAIVDPPQTAIIAVGGVARRPVEREGGGVEFRDQMVVTMSADHRVVYGADGALFLRRLKAFLEHPLTLLANESATSVRNPPR